MTYRSKFSANPFYAATQRLCAISQSEEPFRQPIFARLPLAPVNGSPVPHLTSLYHYDNVGNYGDRSYPGNCGGQLIHDLLLYFKPQNVFDPMTGSGTCRDVCRELNIPCLSLDIRSGFDATDPECYKSLQKAECFDFIWAHPPYWRQKLYTEKPGDLSRVESIEAFLERYKAFIELCSNLLTPGGRFGILMGDYFDRAVGYVPLTYHTKRLAFAAGLRQRDTDIIRFSHGASSSRKTYQTKFIPGLHDVCMIFERG
jgi:hypothetical protein